jgi:YjbE family integral membrane protein
MNFGYQELVALAQVVMIDVALAGDNAIVIGLAASRVSADRRARVMYWGIGGAVVVRLVFAALATQLLAIIGLTLAGGILLLWVCWKTYRELRRGHVAPAATSDPTMLAGSDTSSRGFRDAVIRIVVADVSMSLDNVLAVAGAAKGRVVILVVGLGLSILLTALAAGLVARLLARYSWITWLGLAVILYVALEMIWRGVSEVLMRAVAA